MFRIGVVHIKSVATHGSPFFMTKQAEFQGDGLEYPEDPSEPFISHPGSATDPMVLIIHLERQRAFTILT